MMITQGQLEMLKGIPEIVTAYVSQIPEVSRDLRRGEDSWTIREHVYHIAGVQRLLLTRIETIKQSLDPVIEPYFPEDDTDIGEKFLSIGEALEQYQKMREIQISEILSSTPEQLARTAHHPEYYDYSIPLLVHHMIFHEYWHMYRIEELWLTRNEHFSS